MEKGETAAQPLDDWFINLMVCPVCTKGLPLKLNDDHTALLCACGRLAFPVTQEGIPELLAEKAKIVDESIAPGGNAE